MSFEIHIFLYMLLDMVICISMSNITFFRFLSKARLDVIHHNSQFFANFIFIIFVVSGYFKDVNSKFLSLFPDWKISLNYGFQKMQK